LRGSLEKKRSKSLPAKNEDHYDYYDVNLIKKDKENVNPNKQTKNHNEISVEETAKKS
jgi:hypothetical protein